MTQDNNIPDGMDEFEANKFIRNADDKIFKKQETSGKKPSRQRVQPKKDWKQGWYDTLVSLRILVLSALVVLMSSVIMYLIGKYFVENVIGLKW